VLLPFRSTDRKRRIIDSLPLAFAVLLTPALLSPTGCPQTSKVQPAPQAQVVEPETQQPQTLDQVPARPLNRLIPADYQWTAPAQPGLTSLTPAAPAQSSKPALEPKEHWGCLVHHIRPGESLYTISRRYYGRDQFCPLIKDRNPQAFNDKDSLLAEAVIYLPNDPLKNKAGRLSSPKQIPDSYITAPGDSVNRITTWLGGGSRLRQTIVNLNGLHDPLDKPMPPGTKLMLRLPESTNN
jgi:hypothetical protein